MASPEAKEEHSSTGSAAAAPSVQAPNVEETAEKAAPETKSSNQTRVDEEDSDLDDLDDVLDKFAPKAQQTAQKPSSDSAASTKLDQGQGPGSASAGKIPSANPPPESDFDEEAFMKQIEAGMSELMGGGGGSGSGEAASGTGGNAGATTGDEPNWDELAKQLGSDKGAAELMKLLMGENVGGGEGSSAGASAGAGAGGTGAGAGAGTKDASFQDTIRRTIERMQESGDRATQAAVDDGGGDILEKVLRAVGQATEGGDDSSLDQLFLKIMEQLSNKEMLYEPMKELDAKFGPWLEANGDKVPREDRERYEKQATIVHEIVAKFDEPGYSDEKPDCRAYVWEKMQMMQSAGSPPEELVSNPMLDPNSGDFGLSEALGAGAAAGNAQMPEMPPCPQQ